MGDASADSLAAEILKLERRWTKLRCRQRGTDLSTNGPWAMVFRYTDVWVREDDAWKIDVRQATGRPWTDADGDA